MGGKLEYVFHIYPVKKWKVYDFSGTNLWGKVFKKFNKIMTTNLEITNSKVYEHYLMIDESETLKGTNVSYRYYLDFRKEWDDNTDFWIKAKLIGNQDIKTQESKLKIKLQPFLHVKFSYANDIQKGLIKTYKFMWYDKRIDQLMHISKELFEKIVIDIKTEFGGQTPYNPELIEAWRDTF